jgi:quercetin dioxygenase-like cupin family protein
MKQQGSRVRHGFRATQHNIAPNTALHRRYWNGLLGRMNSALHARRANPAAQPETISHKGEVVCMIVRAKPMPEETTFYTPRHFNLQVGKIVYPAGSEIPRHTHCSVIRNITNTVEVLIVQKGCMILDLYGDDHVPVCSREIGKGDVVVLLSAGHGFRMIEDSVLIEVKQGPYFGTLDKELF